MPPPHHAGHWAGVQSQVPCPTAPWGDLSGKGAMFREPPPPLLAFRTWLLSLLYLLDTPKYCPLDKSTAFALFPSSPSHGLALPPAPSGLQPPCASLLRGVSQTELTWSQPSLGQEEGVGATPSPLACGPELGSAGLLDAHLPLAPGPLHTQVRPPDPFFLCPPATVTALSFASTWPGVVSQPQPVLASLSFPDPLDQERVLWAGRTAGLGLPGLHGGDLEEARQLDGKGGLQASPEPHPVPTCAGNLGPSVASPGLG